MLACTLKQPQQSLNIATPLKMLDLNMLLMSRARTVGDIVRGADLPGFTRSIYERDHALITHESHVWAGSPGWC